MLFSDDIAGHDMIVDTFITMDIDCGGEDCNHIV